MKKILFLLVAVVTFSTAAMAQGTATKSSKAKVTQNEATTVTQKPAGAESARLKKDGTPDKRFKENKNTPEAPAGPTKKDGTPDKRYKANKDAAATPAQK
ncbi:MAG: hypothetical protein K9G49_09340 [Taibaiella sp.]|jgi:hypothetical protein|nr:hypothetical protein [Taibaiella sp.]